MGLTKKVEGYVNMTEYAKMNGFSPVTVRKMIENNRLEFQVFGNSKLIPVGAVPTFKYKATERKFYEEHGVDIVQCPKCPATSCRFNSCGRCTTLTECLYKYHKDGKKYCVFYKTKSEDEK